MNEPELNEPRLNEPQLARPDAARRHCRHCWGDCNGECLLPGVPGSCIHAPGTPLYRRLWLRLRLARPGGARPGPTRRGFRTRV